MRYLFLCAIGPVQDFIATARRSRDLWYGSWMLSELSKAIAKKLGEEYGLNKLIFPAPNDIGELGENQLTSVANKIVAIINRDPKDVGKEARDVVQLRLKALKEEAYLCIKGSYYDHLAEKQVKDLIEFYWVAVEYPENADYIKVRNKAEALLAVRKNTRNFKKIEGEPKPKSSLDGIRESVIPEDMYPKNWEDEEIQSRKIKSLYDCYHARRSERLSGVDLIKRLGGQSLERRFYSTSHIAALPFLQMVDNDHKTGTSEELMAEVTALYKQFNLNISSTVDNSLLYANRISDWMAEGEQQDKLLDKLDAILEKYAGQQRPNPYYALMMADGDGMGKTIDTLKRADAHRKFSQALSNFSEYVRATIPKFEGVLIYSGGDDILAYLPLHQALPCAEQLEKDFREKIGSKFTYQEEGETITPTLSAGIIVAHHLTPLSDVLALTRKAEKEAKSVPGKNSLVITVSKRSGVPRTIKGKWGYLNKRLDKMIKFSNQDIISKGLAYELRELHRTLSSSKELKDALVQEALRIVKRKRESGSNKKISENVIKDFENWLEKEQVPVNELSRELIVSGMFVGTQRTEEEK